MKKRFIIHVMLICTLIILPLGCAKKNTIQEGTADQVNQPVKTVTLKLAENQPPNNPVSEAMVMFADLVKERTGGAVVIDVYLNGQLGSETENIEQVQMGLLDLARVNTVTLSQTVQEVGVFALPYVFKGKQHKYNVLDGPIGTEISEAFKNYNMVNLGYMEAGTRNFYTIKEVTSIEDLKGLKIRVQPSAIPVAMMKALGAVPTPMNYGEVYGALQTGIIDGAENDFTSFYTSSHYEQARFMIEDGHLSPPAVLIMSTDTLNSLTPEQQAIIIEAGYEAAVWERDAMYAFNDSSKQKLIDDGVTISSVDKQPFIDAVQSVYGEYPQFQDILNRIHGTE